MKYSEEKRKLAEVTQLFKLYIKRIEDNTRISWKNDFHSFTVRTGIK